MHIHITIIVGAIFFEFNFEPQFGHFSAFISTSWLHFLHILFSDMFDFSVFSSWIWFVFSSWDSFNNISLFMFINSLVLLILFWFSDNSSFTISEVTFVGISFINVDVLLFSTFISLLLSVFSLFYSSSLNTFLIASK